MITTLRIKKNYDNPLDMAVRWYSVISILNNLKWSPLEVKLVAFTAIKGDISSGGKKETFCELFKSTRSSVGNSISSLFKKGYLIKKEGKTKLHPQLLFDFEGDILAQLNITCTRSL